MSTNTADRISELPEAILHHILSHLPIRDAARTSVLSKWLNNAWETLPYLNFNDESFIDRSSLDWPLRKNRDLLAEMRRIVGRRRNQHVSIVKFSLFIPNWKLECLQQLDIGKKRRPQFDFSCLSVATPFLRELELINGSCIGRELLLPLSFVSAKWLTALTLEGFDLSSSWSSLDINFTCLQKLALELVILDDNIMEKLTLGSRSSLETLRLIQCEGIKTIHLGGEFVKLKRLTASFIPRWEEVVSIDVHDAPEFEDIHLTGCCDFYNVFFTVKNCPILRKVFLLYIFFTKNALHQLLASWKYEELKIQHCFVSKNINISRDSLKAISLCSSLELSNLHIS